MGDAHSAWSAPRSHCSSVRGAGHGGRGALRIRSVAHLCGVLFPCLLSRTLEDMNCRVHKNGNLGSPWHAARQPAVLLRILSPIMLFISFLYRYDN